MDQTDQPVLAWFMAGVLYWCAFAGASLGAVVVALKTTHPHFTNPGFIFVVFAVILIAGLALAGWVGKQNLTDDVVDTENEETDQTRNLYIGAGAVVAFFVTGGIVSAYVLA